jgi:hypothetical protein
VANPITLESETRERPSRGVRRWISTEYAGGLRTEVVGEQASAPIPNERGEETPSRTFGRRKPLLGAPRKGDSGKRPDLTVVVVATSFYTQGRQARVFTRSI